MLPKNYTYRPLPFYLTIKKSEIEGLGLFTTERLPQDKLIGVTHHDDPESEDGLIRTPLGGFINHSDTPNCYLLHTAVGTYHLYTKELILPDTELTLDYNKTLKR